MRKAAWILIAVTAIVLGVLGYGMYGLKVHNGQLRVTTLAATEATEQFEALRTKMDSDALTDRIYIKEALTNPEEYTFVTYTVRVKNVGIIPAEWIELVMVPQEGDVLQLDTGSAHALNAFSEGDLKATLLVKGEGNSGARTGKITYFAFGRPYEVRVTQ